LGGDYLGNDISKLTKDNRGGKREGAGRPATGRKKHQVYVTDEEFEQVKSLIDKLRQEKG
jgi:hypothetical protein